MEPVCLMCCQFSKWIDHSQIRRVQYHVTGRMFGDGLYFSDQSYKISKSYWVIGMVAP